MWKRITLNLCSRKNFSTCSLLECSKGSKIKKRSFLNLVAKNEKSAKMADTLKGLKVTKAKVEDEGDIFVKMGKKVEHKIHPDLIDQKKAMPQLLNQLTPHFREKVIENVTQRIFRLQKLNGWIIALHFQTDFPLPEFMPFYQWHQLLSYESVIAFSHYFFAILEGKEKDEETLKKIKALDDKENSATTLQIDTYMYDQIIGDDEDLQDKWDLICQVFDELVEENFKPPTNLGRGEINVLLHNTNTREDIEKMFKTFYHNRCENHLKYVRYRLVKIESQNSEATQPFLTGQDFETRIQNWSKQRYFRESQLDPQNCVIDLNGFSELEPMKKLGKTYSILVEAVNRNKFGSKPFQLHMTNLGKFQDFYLIRNLFGLDKEDQNHNIENWTEKCYTDIFPKKNIVLITPSSYNDLEYNPEDVYVLPFVHRTGQAKSAEQNGIRHARIPTKKYLGFSASIPTQTSLAVLQDFRNSQDWLYACRWIQPSLYEKVLKSLPYTIRDEYMYLSHKKLHPTDFLSENALLNPQEYRAKMSYYIGFAPEDDGELKVSSNHHKNKMARFLSMTNTNEDELG